MVRSVHLSRALSDLRTRMGVELADLTADELADLVHACDRVANPFRDVNADAAGFPVRVCDGVYFWKLTIGASIWLDEFAAPILGGTSRAYKMALVYALVNAREASAFEGLDSERGILKAVRACCAKIAATADEINEAIDIVLGLKADGREKDVGAASADWSAICCRLESQTGIPAHDWIWTHSSSYAVKAYNDLHDFANAYHAGSNAESMKDELDEATEALQRLKVKIMKRVRSVNV